MTNWQEIRKAAAEAGYVHGWMNAEINAWETIRVDNARSEAEFDNLALGSLQDALANGSLDPAEHEFFVNLGVKF